MNTVPVNEPIDCRVLLKRYVRMVLMAENVTFTGDRLLDDDPPLIGLHNIVDEVV